MSNSFALSVRAVVVFVSLLVLPCVVHAGGGEFPGDGTRNLGRGGAGMARADDPSVMVRNPALLADLWDDQAMLGAHLLIADSCFQPAGSYSLAGGQDAFQLRGQLFAQNVGDNSRLQDGTPLIDINDEPFPEVCYEGPAPFLPQLALAMKLASNLGVGIGFFPPETTQINQFGNRDGTVDTPYGLRPNPLRYGRAHLNTSYFSALAAIGYRPADWLRIGFGFQWQLVALQARTFSPSVTGGMLPSKDVQADLFARDLFIPGAIASIHIVPFDALDIALGAKWSDRIMAKGKLDLTSGAFGVGDTLEFIDGRDGSLRTIESSIAQVSRNQSVELNASPIWVPQLSAGIRFADRLAPRVEGARWDGARLSSEGTVEDSMQNERWDIELDVVYYLTSFQDRTVVSTDGVLVLLQGTGGAPPTTFEAGRCYEMSMGACSGRRSRTPIHGEDQLTFRLGGDYNVLPGVFTVRAGGSYETDGQKPEWMVPFQYLAGRTGLHAGFTIRLMGKTDLSFAFAHFIQKEVRLRYNTQTRNWFNYEMLNPVLYHVQPGGYDGVAQAPILEPGPESSPVSNHLNVGSFYYNLDVVSATLVQHF